MILRGAPASEGRAAGRAWVWRPGAPPPAGSRAPLELVHLETAQRQVVSELHARREAMARTGASEDWLLLLDAHRLMVRDPLLAGRASELVARGARAREAVAAAADEVARQFRDTGDDFLAARIADIEQVRDRLLGALDAISPPSSYPARDALPRPGRPVIVVARDLSADALIDLAGSAGTSDSPGTRLVRALLLDDGGPLTHTAIVARHLGIPCVVGLSELTEILSGGEGLLVDGTAGTVHVNPGPEAVSVWRRSRPPADPPPHGELPDVAVYANIHSPEEGPVALAQGAEGVGLLRTDGLLSAAGVAPSEGEQARRYGRLVREMEGRMVTIRLFDAPVAGPNPALGLRGIRWQVADPDRVHTQLRAICRASREGAVRVLAPMVTHPAEMMALRERLGVAAAAVGVDPPLLGAMIETPAAAWLAGDVARASDFVAVGTNDLLQYLVAADRSDARVAAWLDPDHPALDAVLAHVVSAVDAVGIPLYVCGELAADPRRLPSLLAAGVRAVSVAPSRLRSVRFWLSLPSLTG